VRKRSCTNDPQVVLTFSSWRHPRPCLYEIFDYIAPRHERSYNRLNPSNCRAGVVTVPSVVSRRFVPQQETRI
jgi:hypothetical protein